MCVIAVFMMASAVVQANQCASAGECSSHDEPKRAVSLLQQKLQMNVLKAGDEDFEVGVANRSAEGILDYQCSDTNRAQCPPLWGGAWGASKASSAAIAAANETYGRAHPRCDYTLFKNKVQGPWIPCCEKQQFHLMLQWYHDVVQSHIGDEFWYALVDGTLLGAVRDGDMIDWDTDMDIAVPKESMSWLRPLLEEAAAKEDPPYYLSWDVIDSGTHPLRLHMSKDNTAHVDIWPSEGLNQTCVKIGPTASPNFGFFPLQNCTLGNSQFPCPNNAEKFLEYWYGDNWNQHGTNKGNSASPSLPADCAHFEPMLTQTASKARDLSSEVPEFN